MASLIELAIVTFGELVAWILERVGAKGKLKIYIKSYQNDFFCSDGLGGQLTSKSVDKTEHYELSFDLDFINKSKKSKILREINVVFNDGKKDILTHSVHEGHKQFNDALESLNISPNSIESYSFRTALNKNNLNAIWRTKKIYFTYKNENNHTCKVLITNEDFSKYFENHNQEATENEQT